ncbi:MAG: AraC family transcriptional regulator [Terriglobales bacterium]|jgi:AraC-like DNA-binding protein
MIGKTRQQPTSAVEEIYDPEVGKARGMLRRPVPAGKLRHVRRRPAADLTGWIAHYWMIRWDLRGSEPQLAESVPHPNVHVIFEPAASVVAGVQTHKFSRRLEGQSQVFGIKFKPGGFRPFLKFPVSKLADRTIPVERVFGNAVRALEELVLSGAKENEKVEAANQFFRSRLPAPDETVELAGQLVEEILNQRDIKTVDDLVARSGMGKRSLQRMFQEYVGVSPKWVIRRYRLHELIERSHSGERTDWSQLALELGYFDQAHLINDFRSITGFSPTEYQSLVRGNSRGKD